METTEFTRRYPYLYHMAEAGAWPAIQRHGLLSTSALLDLFALTGPDRERVERRRRPDFVRLDHAAHGQAWIRDQKPMSDETLAPVLRDGLTPADWYELLNRRVFFWVDPRRLEKLLHTYRHRDNVVLVLDSARVLADHADRVTLSPINSGYSRRYAQPRGRDTFRRLAAYPGWQTRPDGRRTRTTVAECALDDRLPAVETYLTEFRRVPRRGPAVDEPGG